MAKQNGTSALHMVQLWLDARRLATLGQMLGLLKRRKRVGTPYLVHCALGELFQEQAPRPFSVDDAPRSVAPIGTDSGRLVRMLGYSRVDGETLHELAKGFASPPVYEICRWERCASKPMPRMFPEGLRLGFELRACPVIRKGSAGTKWKAGQEIDAFLDRALEVDDPTIEIDREEVYGDWLKRQFDLRGGAEVLSVGMERFSIERMTRRTQGTDRKAITIQRPDVTLKGMLAVTDAGAFAGLLRDGIGRHKSFGFGMLKIRRA